MADPAVQKAILKVLLSLPSPVLRAMSGGGVVYQGGRTLDPRFQFHLYDLDFCRSARAAGPTMAMSRPGSEKKPRFGSAPTSTIGGLCVWLCSVWDG